MLKTQEREKLFLVLVAVLVVGCQAVKPLASQTIQPTATHTSERMLPFQDSAFELTYSEIETYLLENSFLGGSEMSCSDFDAEWVSCALFVFDRGDFLVHLEHYDDTVLGVSIYHSDFNDPAVNEMVNYFGLSSTPDDARASGFYFLKKKPMSKSPWCLYGFGTTTISLCSLTWSRQNNRLQETLKFPAVLPRSPTCSQDVVLAPKASRSFAIGGVELLA